MYPLLLCVALFAACKKEEPPRTMITPPRHVVYVVTCSTCEYTYMDAEGELESGFSAGGPHVEMDVPIGTEVLITVTGGANRTATILVDGAVFLVDTVYPISLHGFVP